MLVYLFKIKPVTPYFVVQFDSSLATTHLGGESSFILVEFSTEILLS